MMGVDLAVFAVMALLLAGLGVYAAVAHAVAQRRQEIGIRVVLGATRSEIVRLVMRDGLLMVGIGCAAGIAVGVVATRLMQGLLFGVSPADSMSFAAAVAILSLIACTACYFPARKAAAAESASHRRGGGPVHGHCGLISARAARSPMTRAARSR